MSDHGVSQGEKYGEHAYGAFVMITHLEHSHIFWQKI